MRRPTLAFLNRLWRLIGTGLSFVVFGLGGLLGSFVLMPIIFILVRDPERRRTYARRCIGPLLGFFAWFMAALGLLRWTVTGLETVDKSQSYLVLANHPSLIDVVFLLALFPQASCVVKKTLWRNPLTGLTLRTLGYISNHTPVETLQACIAKLKEGHSLILFPEGTRTVPGRRLHFQRGAAAIAVRSGCDVLPVVITCSPVTLTKGEPWYRMPDGRVEIGLEILEPIPARFFLENTGSMREATAKCNDYLLDFFSEKLRARAMAPETLGQNATRG